MVMQTGVKYDDTVSPEHELTGEPSADLRPGRPRACSIADALELVGERYSLLIVRELSRGVTHFNEIRDNTGAPRETLANRLRKLEEVGVIMRRRYSEHPPRDEYLLTDAGQALDPVLASLRLWGAQHAGQA